MTTEEMGYELKLYIGTAGATAATQVENATDVDYDLALEKGSTTARGTGGVVPIKTENAVSRNVTITWKMLNDPDDTDLTTIIAAAIVGGPLAITLTTGSGAVLFDGDCTVAKKYNAPLTGEGTYDFSATPTKASGRSPTLG